MTPPAILLDLDGTLTDSRSGIVASIHAALRDLGIAPDPQQDLTWVIGPPLEQVIDRVLAHYNDTRGAETVRLYRENYGRTGLFDNALYPGIPALLQTLVDAGHRLFLATAKRTRFAIPILGHFGLARHFTGIHGSEDDGRFDHKDALIAHILATHGLDAGHAIMVGDRVHDIAGARANAMPAIGVAWGYGGRAELEAAGAATVIDHAAELPAAIRAISDRMETSGRRICVLHQQARAEGDLLSGRLSL